MAIVGYDIAIALLSITIAISGIIFGLGYALDDRKIKDIGKVELYTALFNGIIVGVLIVSFSPSGIVGAALNSITSNVTNSYSCPPQMAYNTAICFSYNYIAGTRYVSVYNSSYPTVFDSTVELLVPLASVYAGLSIVNSMGFELGPISLGLSGAMKPIITPIGYAIDALSVALISIEVQGILLLFISATAMSILMPVGIALRCLYFTRKLGGTILAITIGLFAVLPMSYVLGATIINGYATTFSSSSVNATISNVTSMQGGLLVQSSAYQSGHASSNGAFGAITGLVSGFVGSVQQFLTGLENYVAIIIIESFVLPTFSLILTVASIKELAKLLGAEINLGRFNII